MTYGELLRDPRWQRRRLEVMDRDGWACRHCEADDQELQVHHKRYSGGAPWEVPMEWLVTLCKDCHGRVTELRRTANDILAEMTADELAAAVGRLYGTEPAERPAMVQEAILDYCDRQRAAILSQPFTMPLSRMLESVDYLEDHVWLALAKTQRN